MIGDDNRDRPIWIDGTPCCPICGGEVTCEEADTEYGTTQQATPYVCLPCNWYQEAPVLTDDPNDQEYLDDDPWSS
jgi:hypothetical protein